MRKLKTRLIHWLGGYTPEEKCRPSNSFRVGCYCAAIAIKIYADSLWGKPAETWCQLMYKHLNECITKLEREEQ